MASSHQIGENHNMHKTFIKLLSIVLLGLLVGCAGNHRGEMRNPSSLIRNMGDKTVALVHQDDEGEYKVYCTGVWISEDEILTAHHCMQGLANMIAGVDDEFEADVDPMGVKTGFIVESEVEGVGEQPSSIHFGKAVALDEMHDLAIVKVIGKNVIPHRAAELANIGPAVGEDIFVVGHTKGLYWSYTRGNVTAYRGTLPGVDKAGPFLQFTAPIFFGNSGGGVFDDDGKLVGIVSFMMRAPSTNFAIELKSIDKMIKDYKEPQHKLL